MARPRVFISSTFYDLRQIREDLERFIRDLGYEPIRNETGAIAYGKDEAPESYAYKELDLCDIVVSVVGGRYGTESRYEKGYSISQTELKRALDQGIQVFIFVQANVLAEYSTYKTNKDNENTKYAFVDNKKVYEFLETLYALPRNNPIAPFETSVDIVNYLKLQWAGLFQRFLQDQKRAAEMKVLDEMKSVASTLEQLVDFITEEREKGDSAIQSILLANHPAFRNIADVTSTPYRIFFTNYEEMSKWLTARNWDQEFFEEYEWFQTDPKGKMTMTLKINPIIFDEDGKLRIFTEDEWEDEWVTLIDKRKPSYTFEPDDDLPF